MISLKKADYEKILAHAKSCVPEEACGLIAGTKDGEDKVVEKVYLLANIDHSNEHFTLDPKEQLSAIKDMRANGLKPLGKCIHGYGNNGSDGYEGCIYKNTYCTYFHGSLLAKNPELADRFIKTALEIKYSEVALEKLDDSLELKAKEVMINRLNNNQK